MPNEPARASPRKVYFDLTDALDYARHFDTVSGIPRTALRIVGQLVDQFGRDNVRLMAWHPTRQEPYEIANDWCTADYEFSRRHFARAFDLDRNHVRSIRRWANTHYAGRSFFRRHYHLWRARVSRLVGRAEFFTKRKIDLPGAIGNGLRPLMLEPGDAIVILGATWNNPKHMAFLHANKRAGVHIAHFIHDLVPLLLPEHVPDGIPEQFREWIDEMSELADAFLANSESTKRDIQAMLLARGLDKPVRAVPLAHEFRRSPSTQISRPVSARVLSEARLPYVLCVGTVEARKNPWGLGKVWKKLVAELGLNAPRLIFAGKHGWLKEDFDNLMQATGHIEGHVRIVENPSEQDLVYLYQHCLFTVMPSFYEGWGLPVGESLWFGKTCVTSSNSALPEVGGDMCAYADPHDLDSLYAAVKRMAVDTAWRGQFEGRISRDRLRTWRDVGADFWIALKAELDAMPGTASAAAPPASGRRDGGRHR